MELAFSDLKVEIRYFHTNSFLEKFSKNTGKIDDVNDQKQSELCR
jgi:hypothetical protein